jgi:hypothetical protein
MREEFGVPGTNSGPFLEWAVETLLNEIRNGAMPSISDATDEVESDSRS